MRTTNEILYGLGHRVHFSEAKEAILGTYDNTLLIVVFSWLGKRVYVRSMYSVARTC